MWIIVVLVIGFVVWHFLPEPKPSEPSPTFRREPRAVASDPLWAKYVEEHCESPAETAFLRAMIKAYDLKPEAGSLAGSGIRLDFQVEEGCYRTDFMANKWLVIEIDGAAYHSSEEAVARDKARDAYFESLGYSVLRIPAKVVFNKPDEATRRVKAALKIGRRPVPVSVPKSGWQRLSETMVSISKGIEEMNEHARRSRAVQLGLEPATAAFRMEKMVIETAITSAKRQLDQDDWLSGQDEPTRIMYKKHLESVKKAIAGARGEPEPEESDKAKPELLTFPSAPLLSDIPEHNNAIGAAYSRIVEERERFLKSQGSLIACDHRLKWLFVKEVWRLGYSATSQCTRAVLRSSSS